ncbi:MAG TPA: Nif3-like dinuclear metal center hexameric protein [Methanoregula sp.]|jgi:dinuclear metal center YbgI/SA1388 family protein|nr:Nif3-like dinuclear metal center hexameric protein [Methanoregula sp.]
MHVHAFIEEMERLAPPELAEDFDAGKIGLVVEGRPEISRVCCALDATPCVVQEAVLASADMLVVHHTPLWTPVTAITGRVAGLMRALLSADMNLYVMHTNFDRAPEGVNDALAEILSLKDVSRMSTGCIGSCTLSPAEISKRLGGNCRLWGKVKKIRRLALVAGSGFDPAFLEEAKALGADTFLSAEMKHSVARTAALPCIEATHYALEAPAMQRLSTRMDWKYIDDPPAFQIIP